MKHGKLKHGKLKKVARKPTRERIAATSTLPEVRLDRNRIVISNTIWAPPSTLVARIIAAEGTLIPRDDGAVLAFPRADQAEKVFNDAFNVELGWEEFAESVPDDTHWCSAEMEEFAQKIVDGG